jgi:hypothetical protein
LLDVCWGRGLGLGLEIFTVIVAVIVLSFGSRDVFGGGDVIG